MKYHKIKNVPLETCTCEQKIAYNLAFSHYTIYIKSYNNAPFAFQKSTIIHRAVNDMIKHYKNSYDYVEGKYNIDAIFCALNAGLENYFNTKYKILSSYEDIGKIFPANYLK